MMKRMLVLYVAVCATANTFGIAASQAWVSNYVERAISSSAAQLQATATVTATNGASEIRLVDATRCVRLVIEDSTDAALLATNCTTSAVARGITDGTAFVWNGSGGYVNPIGVISCTPTNFVFAGVGSVATNGVDRFVGWFDVYGALLQPDASFAITNGMMEVAR